MAVAVDEPAHPAFAAAASALAELASLDLDGLSGRELAGATLVVQRLRGALEAAEARVLARWDAEKVWRVDGAKTGPAWLAWQQRIPIEVARQRVRHARALRTMPEVEEAWRDGDIDRSHLTTMLSVRTSRTKDAFETDYKALLDSARTQGFRDFKRRCDMWEQTVDQDGPEQGAQEQRKAREAYLSESLGGMWYGRQIFDPISGTIISTTLKLIERELFDADWAAAKARLGRDPLIVELDRTPAQRRADAMVEMAVRARNAPADGRRPVPLFTVLVGYETFAGPTLELHNGTVITPRTAAAWLDGADIERVVFDGPSRVIDVGVQRRFYTGALRRAIEIRDRTCFHDSCDEVPERPEIDHIHQAAKGGPTTQANGRLACSFHNKWRNRTGATGNAVDRASPRPDDPDAGPDPPDA